MRRDVTFVSQGLNCVGWLYTPDDLRQGERRPAIVMAHGFSATKEMYLANFAERFVAAGLVTLVFDYRYFGGSEGEPRGQLIPAEQHEDYRNAITWASLQPEVDPERIGVWGSSYSGAHVLHLAAFDRRIKAAVAQVPLVDGWANAQRLMRADVFGQFIESLAQDRLQRYQNGAVNYVNVVAPEGEPSALPTPESYEWFMRTSQTVAPSWKNQVTMESMERFLEYNPAANIHRISPTPLLMILASDDRLTPTDLAVAAYERAREPRSLVFLPGGHFGAYAEPGLSLSASAATDWFRRYLLPSGEATAGGAQPREAVGVGPA
ncbi:MAG TPA: alpha/beta hydrolase [Ktedonobacterales bacterium]|nr:alpha/beta hydrolase [Ktedonobacterales bacterium]